MRFRFNTELGEYQPVGMGILEGAPRAAGTYTFTVELTDADSVKTQMDFSLRVSELADWGIRSATYNTAYSNIYPVVGGAGAPYSCAILEGALPQGLLMNGTCLVSGTPIESGNYSFKLRMRDGASREYIRWTNIYVGSGIANSLDFNGEWIVNRSLNSTWSPGYNAWGGSGSYTWQVLGSPPAGITVPAGFAYGLPPGNS
jgi:hypothetical protein